VPAEHIPPPHGRAQNKENFPFPESRLKGVYSCLIHYAACKSMDGRRWIITAWEPIHRVWANSKCPCLHSDPQFPDCPPGKTVRVRGWLSFEGADVKAEFKRLDRLRSKNENSTP